MIDLKAGSKAQYKGNMPYILSNGQQFEKEGEVQVITSNVKAQKGFFEILADEKKEDEKVEEVVTENKGSKNKK